MEENENKTIDKEESTIKIYDKYMYKSQKKFNEVGLIIALFIIGFVTGYFSQYMTIKSLEKEISELKTEYVENTEINNAENKIE